MLQKIVHTVCPLIQFLCANDWSIHVQCIHVLLANKEIAQYSVHLGKGIVGTLFVLCTNNNIIHCMPKILNHGLSSSWDLYM